LYYCFSFTFYFLLKFLSWYEGNFASAFTVAAFTSSLNNYISQLTSFSKSSGLGGGSSGGGRGGGGGSW